MTARRILLPAVLVLCAAALAAQQTASPGAAASPGPATGPAQTSGSSGQLPPQSDPILQDGTPLKLALVKEVSSSNAQIGQTIQFDVLNDLAVGGVTVLRRGTAITAVITEAQKKRRMGRAGALSFTISQVTLADGTNVPVRAFNNTNGDSHAAGIAALALNMPMVAAPFFLLMHGENSTIPKGTEITVFISGDIRLDLNALKLQGSGAAAKPEAQNPPSAAAPQ